jgi:hypothetical protein
MMDSCMKSFSVRIDGSNYFDDTNGFVTTWGVAGQYYFNALNFRTGFSNSVYSIVGFKNIDIYGISLNGYVNGVATSAANTAIVQDWNMYITLNGQSSLVSGETNASPNAWNIRTTSPLLNQFVIGKYTPSLNLMSPFTSVRSIEFGFLATSGIAATVLDSVYLIYDLYFTFYYKYEGED